MFFKEKDKIDQSPKMMQNTYNFLVSSKREILIWVYFSVLVPVNNQITHSLKEWFTQ